MTRVKKLFSILTLFLIMFGLSQAFFTKKTYAAAEYFKGTLKGTLHQAAPAWVNDMSIATGSSDVTKLSRATVTLVDTSDQQIEEQKTNFAWDGSKTVVWNIDISHVAGSGLLVGEIYKVKFYNTDTLVDCNTKKANGAADITAGGGTCTLVWEGETQFRVLPKDASSPLNPVEIVRSNIRGAKKSVTTSGIDIGIHESIENGIINNAIDQVTNTIVGVMNGLMANLMAGIEEVLNIGNFIDRPELISVWKEIRTLAMSLLTLGILIIAFANVLQIDIEKYGLNRMLPRLVIAIVLTYFSYIVMGFLLELVAAFQAGLTAATASAGGATAGTGFHFSEAWSDTLSMPGTIVSNGILTIVFLVILFIAFLWLLIVLVVRIAVIWLLVCVAPLAFMMMVMPFTEQFFARWWKEWWKWTFMGPAVLFMLYLSSRLLKAAPVAFGSGSSTSSMLMFVLAIVSLFIAATVPLTMGVSQIWKSLSSGIQGAVKGTRGFANTLSGGRSEAALGIRRNRIQERRKKQVGNFMTGLATSKNPVASFAAGVHTQAERDEAISTQADDLSKAIRLEGIDKKRAQAEYLQATGVRRTALARIMGQEGWFDDDPQNTAAMNRFAEDYTNDAHVRNAVNGNQADLLSAARLANVANASVAGDPSGAIGATEAKTLAKALTSPGDLKTAHIDRMDRQQISELLSNPQKVKVAAEKLDAKRLAMLGRKFDELPQHIQQSISQSLDAEGQQVLGRMQQTSRDYQQKYNTARAQGNQDDMKRYATHHDWRQP